MDQNLMLQLELARLKAQEREREAQERAEVREFELRKFQLEKEFEMRALEMHRDNSNSSVSLSLENGRFPRPTGDADITKLLPKFDENAGEIELYLQSFEKTCRLQNWDPDTWASKLPVLLQGKSFAVYSRMPETDITDYEKIKSALLLAYRVTPEQYRLRFRNLHKGSSESFAEFAYKLEETRNAWLCSKSADTREKVLEEIALEQFYKGLPSDLQVWLNDREPNNLRQAANLADQYMAHRHNARRLDKNHSGDKTTVKKQTFEPTTAPNKNFPSRDGRTRSNLICHYCKKPGHHQANCFKRNRDGHTDPKTVNRVEVTPRVTQSVEIPQEHCLPITINGQTANALRDTGCELSLVHPSLINPDQLTGRFAYAKQPLDAEVKSVPLVNITVELGAHSYTQEVGIAPFLDVDLLFGNDIARVVSRDNPQMINMVQTRASARKQNIDSRSQYVDPPVVHVPLADRPPQATLTTEGKPKQDAPRTLVGESPLDVDRNSFAKLQKQDETFTQLRESLGKERLPTGARIIEQNGLLYREWKSPKKPDEPPVLQLLVPAQFRAKLLSIAHEIPCAGHVGIARVKTKMSSKFFWPGMHKDIHDFVTSCLPCMKAGKSRNPAKAPLVEVPVIEEPFKRVVFDTIGPFPVTSQGNRYALVLNDYGTRYPEATAIPNLHAETIADALFVMFSRLGFPQELQHDKSLSFSNKLMEELWKKTGVRQIKSSSYHAQTNSVVERLNRQLKEALRAMIADHPSDWDTYLAYLLFAIREVPCRTTGFSPFELLYGRRVRGPLDLIKETWDDSEDPNVTNVVEYVLEMRKKLVETSELVRERMLDQQKIQKTWYDKNARERIFDEGQKVLLLIPKRKNKLQCAWKGPFTIVKRLNAVDYVIEMNSRKHDHRVYHVNMIKPFVERAAHLICYVNIPEVGDIPLPETPCANDKRTVREILDEKVAETNLSPSQKQELTELLYRFEHIFSPVPGCTTLVEHEIILTDTEPVNRRPYRTNPRVKEIMRKELDVLLEQGIIRPSVSDYASPLIIVEREGKAPRACVDYRLLNTKTRSDSYPMHNTDELIELIAKAQFISVFDLSRGYHQVQLHPDSIRYSAFSTPFGLFEYTRLGFGLKTAPATFQRLMDKLLEGAGEFSTSYLDDLPAFSQNWNDHLKHLEEVFTRISNANLTIKPEKIQLAKGTVTYLGHEVGSGFSKPSSAKVQGLNDYPRPQTKKDIRAYLGLTGYYSKYVPDYADCVVPLTDMLRKHQPDPVIWTEDADKAFRHLNKALMQELVLQAPDFNKTFYVQTDASQRAIGAVLSQISEDGNEHPVAYLSRKLTPSELNWSTIEKELVSIIYAVTRFKHYLFGAKFVIVTDHNPLRFLDRMSNHNARIMRWSLLLSQFDFEIKFCKGSENRNADALSRVEIEGV